MENNDTPENVEPNEEPEGEELEELELKCLLRKEIPFIPMDTNDSMTTPGGENTSSDTFTSEKVFKAVSQGNAAELHGLLDYLQRHNKRLTSPEFTDETNGKTALLKALLNLKDGRNDTIEVILDIAEKTEDLENLINASYIDPYYKGQAALHVAIERRSFDHVKLLVQKGADVQAKANGKFFQRTGEMGFYFGELPLSLAACTNQPDIVSFLMENPYRRADVTDRDSQGNTVLHTLVVIADNTKENTDMIAKVYDEILVQHNKLDNKVQLEEIENNEGLTPLKLAAKLGKIELFRHMLHREFMDKETRPLSRKFTEWVYGPVHSSLYDITSIDTSEKDSVLAIIIFGSDIPNRPEMLQIEPLRSLLQDKWETFALKLFLMNFLLYAAYLTIFTAVTLYRKDGKPPFPIENFPLDHLRCVGEVLSVFGALIFLYKTINHFWRNPPNFKVLSIDGLSDILFFLQAALLLICVIMYGCGQEEYIGLLVLSLALAWVNLLHYLRGSRQLGMYSVMIQRMILRDLLHFLSVYCVLLFGFSAAFVALIRDSPPVVSAAQNLTADMQLQGGSLTASVNKLSYSDVRFTILELFKITIGMGDLQFTDDVQYKEVYYILLISYIVLTYILLLNMLIALMGNTVERLSKQSENIWNLQRAFTILDMERSLPKPLRHKLLSRSSKTMSSRNSMDTRKFFRVEEMNWKQWRSDLSVNREEEPANHLMGSQRHTKATGTRRPVNLLLKKIRNSREHQRQSYIP